MASPSLIEIPLVRATAQSLEGYGYLVDDFDKCEIEIATWPKQGWRNIDEGTGNEGGVTEGSFETWWKGNILYGRNNAVQHHSQYDRDGNYLLGYACNPDDVGEQRSGNDRQEIYLSHVNYHPDGGQLFYPVDHAPFISPLALAGDDIQPTHFKAFYFDGSQGLYIHPNIWHEGIFTTREKAVFKGKQGKVHARVSVDLPEEFHAYLWFKVPTQG